MFNKIKSLYNSYYIIRRNDGRFLLVGFKHATKYHAKQVWNIIGLSTLTGFILLTAYFLGDSHALSPTITYASTQSSVISSTSSTLVEKVSLLEDEVVNVLAQAESGNASTNSALITYDNNSHSTLPRNAIPSLGCMQFKVPTVQSFYKILHKKDLSNYDATLLALDCAQAKSLAKESIFTIPGAIYNWSTATPEIIQKVTFIKELMK